MGWKFIKRTAVCHSRCCPLSFICAAGRHVYLTDDLLLSALFGGIIIGCRHRTWYWQEAATTGGTDMLAALIRSKTAPVFRCADHAGVRWDGGSGRCGGIWRPNMHFMP